MTTTCRRLRRRRRRPLGKAAAAGGGDRAGMEKTFWRRGWRRRRPLGEAAGAAAGGVSPRGEDPPASAVAMPSLAEVAPQAAGRAGVGEADGGAYRRRGRSETGQIVGSREILVGGGAGYRGGQDDYLASAVLAFELPQVIVRSCLHGGQGGPDDLGVGRGGRRPSRGRWGGERGGFGGGRGGVVVGRGGGWRRRRRRH